MLNFIDFNQSLAVGYTAIEDWQFTAQSCILASRWWLNAFCVALVCVCGQCVFFISKISVQWTYIELA